MKTVKSSMVSAVLGGLATPPGNNHWEYTCKQCHQTFETPVAKFKPSEEEVE